MKKQQLQKLVKLKQAELQDLEQELQQVSALEEVLASKPLTNKEEIDKKIRSKVIDLILDKFTVTPKFDLDDSIEDEVVVVDDDEPSEPQPKVSEQELRAEAKAEVEAEQSTLTVLEEGQTLDDLEVEDEDEGDGLPAAPSRSLKKPKLKKSSPSGQPQPSTPPASFYESAADGNFNADNIPPEYLARAKAKRTDDGETAGAIRRRES